MGYPDGDILSGERWRELTEVAAKNTNQGNAPKRGKRTTFLKQRGVPENAVLAKLQHMICFKVLATKTVSTMTDPPRLDSKHRTVAIGHRKICF